MLNRHFAECGASYPIGGASEIAFSIIPVIEKTGGRVLVRANVTGKLAIERTRVNGKGKLSIERTRANVTGKLFIERTRANVIT